jgi:hypothetical protein
VYPVLVHNQCSDLELVSPAYFGYNAIWHMPPDQKVDANTVARAGFGRDITKDEFASALIYKLQRRKCPESDDQSNADSTKDTSTSLQLLVIWKANDWHDNKFFIRVLLIKHSNATAWDEDTLEKLHSTYCALLKDDYNIKDIWMLDDATVLITTSNWKYVSCATKITISEGTREDDFMEPLCIPSSICM